MRDSSTNLLPWECWDRILKNAATISSFFATDGRGSSPRWLPLNFLAFRGEQPGRISGATWVSLCLLRLGGPLPPLNTPLVVKTSLMKCWSTLATLPRITASHLRTLVHGAYKVTHFCLICLMLANASMISPQRRRFSTAGCTCYLLRPLVLSCLRDLRRRAAKRLYSFIISPLDGFPPLIDNTESGLRTHGFLARNRSPRTSFAAESTADLYTI